MQIGRLKLLIAAGVLAGALLAIGAARLIVERQAMGALAEHGRQRLALYAGTLDSALQKYDYLPFILARDQDVLALLDAPQEPALRDRVNDTLERVNAAAGSSALYLMDASGLTLAASNWREPQSFVGSFYGFRPYFTAAVASGAGRYFGVGVTTGQPGYFLAQAVRREGALRGVVVVKLQLDGLAAEWVRGGEDIMLTDANGIVFLASHPDWTYRSLAPIAADIRARIAEARQYGAAPLDQLPIARREAMASGDEGLTLRAGGAERRFLMQSLAIPQLGWTLRYLSDLDPAAAQGRIAALLAGAAILLLVLVALFFRQRRHTARVEREARAALEQRVAERTAALSAVNQRLEGEIAERRRAEAELVQAGKLAVLGQMSAAIAHELNQPLAALQTFLASTRIFAERGDAAQVAGNLGLMADLARRMARIADHLRAFAHKSPGRRGRVALAAAVERALLLLETRSRLEGVAIEISVPAAAAVLGDEVRIEQVLVNLVRNALDAMAGMAVRRLAIVASAGAAGWALRVADSGAGIAAADRHRLFDPFFTTKGEGGGLGLGLSLSKSIITDLGGTIRAESNPEGGASFIIELPAATEGEDGTLSRVRERAG